jgi:DNA helicase-2/ATP-dependent DNA helicase PcrA
MLDLRQTLNPEQYRATVAPDGPALVIAAAGSGKTRTLTHRVAYLVDQGVPAKRILLLTFTNKAAKEMLDRTGVLVGDASRGLWGGTFHSIALRFLRFHGDRLGLKQGFSILGDSDARDLLKRTREELLDPKSSNSAPGADLIAQAMTLSRSSLRDISTIVAERMPDWVGSTEFFQAVVEQYAQAKTSMGVLDFDDFLVEWYNLLRNHRDVLGRYSEQFRYVLVDEYQDTSVIESRIIDMLASRHRNLMVVGDDGQSIYSFRGADVSNILGFKKRWPDAKLYPLETNYRSRPPIIALANVVLNNATERIPKVLRPARTGGNLPEVHVFDRQVDEAGFVADEIRKLRRRAVAPSQIAVLYRAHYQSTDVQMALTKQGITYDIRSGVRFAERSHIKDVVAHLQVLMDPLDRFAWQRLLRLLDGAGSGAIEGYFSAVAASAASKTKPRTAKSCRVRRSSMFRRPLKSARSCGAPWGTHCLHQCQSEW